MTERNRILLLSIASLVIVSGAVASVVMGLLYRAAFEQQRSRLIRMVEHRAGILETVAEFDAELSAEGLLEPSEATEVSRILEVYKSFAVFGETGEFTLARRRGTEIAWLLRPREVELGLPPTSPFDPRSGQPMSRALNGESGTMVGTDYRGTRVLAAYRPVPDTGWGIVSKIDLAEVQEPFLRAGLLAAGVALLLTAAGVGLMLRLTSPLVRSLETRVAHRTAQLSEANESLKREILERQEAEGALRRMSKVFMEAVDPMMIQDLSGRIVDLNAEVERTYGWTRDELLGQSIDMITPRQFHSRQQDFMARCLKGEKVRDVEGVRRTRAGELVPVLLAFSLLTDEKGEGVGIATIAKDLTEQKRLERELRSAAAAATLAEEKERRKLAVDLHDGVGQLLGLLSMKLGALRTSAKDFGRDSEVRQLEQLNAEAQKHASSLIFQLSPPILHDVGLVAASQWLAEDLQHRYGLNVTLESDGERQLLDEATRITLFRAESELLINVAKHAGTHDARVRIWSQEQLLHVSIEDDGAGFDMNKRKKGYGLFSIRERVTHLGGSVEIESTPGTGTKVVMTVPVVTKPEERAEEST